MWKTVGIINKDNMVNKFTRLTAAQSIAVILSVETHDLLLIFSSKQLNLGLEEEVIDMEGNVGDSEDEDLDGEQKDLSRNELCGLQYRE
jgi:hypothetical protein